MEAITLILAALAAGTAQVAGDVVLDTYSALKVLIQNKISGEPVAEAILIEYEKDPATYAAPLKKNLLEAGVDQDDEILKTAQQLLQQLQSQAVVPETINIGQGAKGIIGQTVTGATIIGDIN